MYSGRVFLAGLVFVGVGVGSKADELGHDADLERQFRNGIALAADHFDDFSIRLRVRRENKLVEISKKTAELLADREEDPKAPKIEEYECAVIGLDHAIRTGARGEEGYWEIGNPEYAFMVTKLGDSPHVALGFVEQHGNGSDLSREVAERAVWSQGTCMAGYYMGATSLFNMVGQDEFVIQQVSKSNSYEGDLVRVDFSWQAQDAKYSDCYLISDPRKGWALREYGWLLDVHVNGAKIKQRVVLEYDASASGVAVAKQLERFSEYLSDAGSISRDLWTFEPLSAPVKKEEFYLSYYGLPEPKFESDVGKWLVWVVVGVVFVASSIFIKRRTSKIT